MSHHQTPLLRCRFVSSDSLEHNKCIKIQLHSEKTYFIPHLIGIKRVFLFKQIKKLHSVLDAKSRDYFFYKRKIGRKEIPNSCFHRNDKIHRKEDISLPMHKYCIYGLTICFTQRDRICVFLREDLISLLI